MTNEERDELARRVTEKVRRLGHWEESFDNMRLINWQEDLLDIDRPEVAGVLFSRILEQCAETSTVTYDKADVDECEAPVIVSWATRHSTKADTWQRAVALAYLDVGE